MALRRSLSLISGRREVVPPADYLANTGDFYAGTTRYEASQLRNYANSGTTDSNGRIVFNLTTDGTAGGTALYSAILGLSAIAQNNSGTTSNLPYFIVETISANLKQVTIRGLSAQSGLIILGIGISQTAFVGSGITGWLTARGLP